MPHSVALASIIKVLLKSDKANTRVEDNNCLRCWKANLASYVYKKLSFLSMYVRGFAITPYL